VSALASDATFRITAERLQNLRVSTVDAVSIGMSPSTDPAPAHWAAERESVCLHKQKDVVRKDLSFHGGDYEEWCLLGCYAVWLL
jgi:hypothetical protein